MTTKSNHPRIYGNDAVTHLHPTGRVPVPWARLRRAGSGRRIGCGQRADHAPVLDRTGGGIESSNDDVRAVAIDSRLGQNSDVRIFNGPGDLASWAQWGRLGPGTRIEPGGVLFPRYQG